MVSLLGLSTTKCPVCGMKLAKEMQVYEWQGKKFCSQECKRNFRVKTNTGKSSGASCH